MKLSASKTHLFFGTTLTTCMTSVSSGAFLFLEALALFFEALDIVLLLSQGRESVQHSVFVTDIFKIHVIIEITDHNSSFTLWMKTRLLPSASSKVLMTDIN